MINRIINLQIIPKVITNEHVADVSRLKSSPALHLANSKALTEVSLQGRNYGAAYVQQVTRESKQNSGIVQKFLYEVAGPAPTAGKTFAKDFCSVQA